MKVSEGFQTADSRNLPKVDYLMLLEYMQENECYNAAETRSAKILLASREAYVDTAVGYVEVRREQDLCITKCRVTPEHKVKGKLYLVTATVKETEGKLINIECNDCASSAGGCKHAICFAMWLIKRTDEAPSTSVTCYWTKPKLSSSVTQGKFVMAKDIGRKRRAAAGSTVSADMNVTFDDFLEECRKRHIDEGMILKYSGISRPKLNVLSIFNLMLEFVNKNNDHSYKHFMAFAENCITSEIINRIADKTKDQAESKLWHSLRQGRLTGSTVYDAIHCKTENGSLVQKILGGYKVPETKAIRRGKILEKQVLKQIELDVGAEAEKTGLILISPTVGASPDGLFEDFVVEIKCPFKKNTIKNYVNSGLIQEKFKAQIMLQMHAAKKTKGIFCIADPDFETNRKIYKYYVDYDNEYVDNLMKSAEKFWEQYIFPLMLNSAK